MSPFVRFIFVVVVVGVVVNLTIVVLANTNSARRQAAAVEKDQKKFEELLERINGRLRRMDVAVEWQKLGAREEVLETSLLVRQYRVMGDDPAERLPVVRVRIPGGRVYVDALQLEFDQLFSPEHPEFQMLRGATLWQFQHIFGEGQKKEEWVSLLPEYQVPEASRLYLDREYPGYFEMRVWGTLWEMIHKPERAAKLGVKVKEVKAAGRAVRTGRVYSAYVGIEGVTLEEVDSMGLLNDMLGEAMVLERQDKLEELQKEGSRP